jgi:hypothetical protein
MKKFMPIVLPFLFVFVPSILTYGQDIMVIPGDTVISGNLDSEMVLYIQVVNISSVIQTIFLVRTENNLPEGWTSSLCFGGLCFSPYLDSVATSSYFSLEPVYPSDTIEASVHISPDIVNAGTAHIQIQIGTTHNSDIRTTINLTASTMPTVVNEQVNALDEFSLMQNYPNPFNPSTRIEFTIANRSNVCLEVYDITGRMIETLVNEVKDPGTHNVSFDGKELASGIYLYTIITGNSTAVRKMLLIK